MDMIDKAAKARAALQQLRDELNRVPNNGAAQQVDAIDAYLVEAMPGSLARLYDLVRGLE